MADVTTPEQPDRAAELVAQLSLEEKASLTAGGSIWHLPPLEGRGVGRLKMSDGPSGIRGETMGSRRSLWFACGLALGATWDVDLAGRYGTALGEEARAKGVHLVLGPTVCIVRTPLAGRTFESLAEDPLLTARLVVPYIRGVQAQGVGCCVKHFACNDQEHERMTISAEVDPVSLREVHLAPFEAAVRQAGVWAVMSAYNRVNGTYCGEHPILLGQILRGEWGFDGVVVSDWLGTRSTVESTTAGLDVEMPGPGQFLGGKLAAAVEAGQVDDAMVDDHARRVGRLLDRVGLLDGPPRSDEAEDDDPERRTVARELATNSTVLLCNDGILPLRPRAVRRVALIGPNAMHLAPGGGGSSMVTPLRNPSLADELGQRLPGVELTYEEGCRLERGVPLLDPQLLPDGLRIDTFTDVTAGGQPPGAEPSVTEVIHRSDSITIAQGSSAQPATLRATAAFVPDLDGRWVLGLANTGTARLLLDGEVIVDNREPAPGSTFYGLGSEIVTADVELRAGGRHELVVECQPGEELIRGFGVHGRRPELVDGIARAAAAARNADVAVVVVGANSQLETEGADRRDLRLVGQQEELVAEVATANPNTVVVLNAGGPVAVPWVDDVAAALTVWYPGEEGAPALAGVLVGEAEPGGRLPVTFPRRLEDTSAHGWYPGDDSEVVYGEGLLVGYRHFDAEDLDPTFCFGHGLSYTTFDHGEPSVEGRAPEVFIRTPVTNTGERAGVEVVQVYAGAVERDATRPVRQLAGFAKVSVDPGETVTATVALGRRAFARWEPATGAWVVDPGAYDLSIGASSRDLRHTVRVDVV